MANPSGTEFKYCFVVVDAMYPPVLRLTYMCNRYISKVVEPSMLIFQLDNFRTNWSNMNHAKESLLQNWASKLYTAITTPKIGAFVIVAVCIAQENAYS